MQLLIDIGNTAIKWASNTPGELITQQCSARHFGALPLDVCAAWESIAPPTRIVLASVGPASVTTALITACQAYWQLTPELVNTARVVSFAASLPDAPLRTDYIDPLQLGLDRWLALLAVHCHSPGAALIIDAGSAITYDVLLARGHHGGGFILPGIEAMRTSLFRTTQLPSDLMADTHCAWATNTGGAIAGACLQSPVAFAARLWQQLCADTNSEPPCLLTGGDAERLLPLFTGMDAVQWCPTLVLQGLALVAAL